MSFVPSSRRLLTVTSTSRWVRSFSDMPPASYLGRVRDKRKYALDQTEPVVRSASAVLNPNTVTSLTKSHKQLNSTNSANIAVMPWNLWRNNPLSKYLVNALHAMVGEVPWVTPSNTFRFNDPEKSRVAFTAD